MRLSIIIPTLNEARYLPIAVAQARRQAILAPVPEIIVADGGSKDGTAELAAYYGDQGLFVRASVFRVVGGYREQRLLEASEFCKRVRRRGKLMPLHKYMKTSARRFIEGGISRVLVKDVWIWWLDLLGRPTEQFGRAYQKDNRRRGRPFMA